MRIQAQPATALVGCGIVDPVEAVDEAFRGMGAGHGFERGEYLGSGSPFASRKARQHHRFAAREHPPRVIRVDTGAAGENAGEQCGIAFMGQGCDHIIAAAVRGLERSRQRRDRRLQPAALVVAGNQRQCGVRQRLLGFVGHSLTQGGRNIADLTATTESGQPLAVTRVDDLTWRIATDGATRVVVRYSAAVRDAAEWARPNNRWFLRETSGLVDGPRTFLYLAGWTLAPSHVTFRLPVGWEIGTGLVPTTARGAA